MSNSVLRVKLQYVRLNVAFKHFYMCIKKYKNESLCGKTKNKFVIYFICYLM